MSAMPLSSPWIMQNINLWDCVTGGASLESYEREEIIYEQGEQMDCVYVVKCGRVRLSSVGCGGNEQIFMFMEQGSMFGETDFYERGLRICRATAICKTTLYRVELDDFRRQLEENLDFCHNLMALWSQKLNLLTGRIESLAFTDTYSRCAQVLLNLMEMYGEKVDGGYRIGVEVTHQNIANLVTSTRVHHQQDHPPDGAGGADRPGQPALRHPRRGGAAKNRGQPVYRQRTLIFCRAAVR